MNTKPLIALLVSSVCLTPAMAGEAVSAVNGKLQGVSGNVDGNNANALRVA